MRVKLLTKAEEAALLKNGRASQETGDGSKLAPVVKLFTPDAQCTWLLTEIDPEEPSQAFGLCDLGMGYPELGWVSLEELAGVRGQLGLPIERDRFFRAKFTIAEYAERARQSERIVA